MRGQSDESQYVCPCDPKVGGGCEATRRGTPELCAATDRLVESAQCSTCTETTLEQHPRRTDVQRCANCKGWLRVGGMPFPPEQAAPS